MRWLHTAIVGGVGVALLASLARRLNTVYCTRSGSTSMRSALNKSKEHIDATFDIEQKHFETIGSTNTYALDHFHEFSADALTVITANEQTAGKGRGDRVWVSARSLNVYASFALCLPLTTNHIPNITQILALSAIDCLQQCGVQDVLLKWPNDLVIRDSKLGGILAQSTTGGGIAAGCIAVVVGIGININATTDDLSAIQRPIWPPTSVYIATGKTLDLQQVRQALIASFANNLREFLSSGYSVFVPRISKLLALRGQSVRMNDGETEWEGVQQGITPEGFLQLQLADGTIKTFVSAEHVHNVRPA